MTNQSRKLNMLVFIKINITLLQYRYKKKYQKFFYQRLKRFFLTLPATDLRITAGQIIL